MSDNLASKINPKDINLFDLQTLVDPYPAYKVLRDEAPIHYLPEMDIFVVTRYDLIREAIKDTKTYSNEDCDEPLAMNVKMSLANASPEILQKIAATHERLAGIDMVPTMRTLDEPGHNQFRSLVSQLFTGSRVKKQEAQVNAIVEKYADSFVEESQPTDFVQGFGLPVPLRVIADRYGITEEDRPFFNEAATSAATALRFSPTTPEMMLARAEISVDLQFFLIDLMETRRVNPLDDMISTLATSKLERENRYLTHGEALSILGQFLVAGHETTASSLGWGVYLLCKNPHLQDELRDGDPKLMSTFVEEVLRLEAPVQGLPRLVTRDTELGGHPFKKGQIIMLKFGAGNRDERQFSDPDKVDVHRQKAAMHMAFGSGVHHCAGAPLARQELKLSFPALLKRMENIRLSSSHPEPVAEPSFVLRNLPHLYIEFDRRG